MLSSDRVQSYLICSRLNCAIVLCCKTKQTSTHATSSLYRNSQTFQTSEMWPCLFSRIYNLMPRQQMYTVIELYPVFYGSLCSRLHSISIKIVGERSLNADIISHTEITTEKNPATTKTNTPNLLCLHHYSFSLH